MLDNHPPPSQQPQAIRDAQLPHEWHWLASAHPAVIYRYLHAKSPELSLQLLPLLTDEQFVRLIDYDVWHKDRLSPLAAIGWLKLYSQISNVEMIRRFRSLDEEYQLAIIAPLLTLTSVEELEKLPVSEQDCYVNLPCQELCYRITAGQRKDVQEFLHAFIDAALEQDIGYTYSLLQHAHFSVPNEQEALIAQFRSARIAEDGYCSATDAAVLFRAVELEEYLQKWHKTDTPQTWQRDDFFDHVVSYCQTYEVFSADKWQDIQIKMIMCANTLCAATHAEINDAAAARQSLEQARAMLALALDYLSTGVPKHAAEILAQEQALTLYRIGITLCLRLQQPMLATMHKCALPKIDKFTRLHAMRKWQALAELIDIEYLDLLDIAQVELLKATFSYAPMVVIAGKEEKVHCMFNYQQLLAQTTVLADTMLLAYGQDKPRGKVYASIRKHWGDSDIDVAQIEAYLTQQRQKFYRSFSIQNTLDSLHREITVAMVNR